MTREQGISDRKREDRDSRREAEKWSRDCLSQEDQFPLPFFAPPFSLPPSALVPYRARPKISNRTPPTPSQVTYELAVWSCSSSASFSTRSDDQLNTTRGSSHLSRVLSPCYPARELHVPSDVYRTISAVPVAEQRQTYLAGWNFFIPPSPLIVVGDLLLTVHVSFATTKLLQGPYYLLHPLSTPESLQQAGNRRHGFSQVEVFDPFRG